MRSRYSAFATHNADYLMRTLAPQFHSSNGREQLQRTFATTDWLGLQILRCSEQQDRGQVEFVAFFRQKPHGQLEQLHEVSEFIKVDNSWFYTHGRHLPAIKLQRNHPCFCGSGKKLKKCCLNKLDVNV